jgi:hypothetical protein
MTSTIIDRIHAVSISASDEPIRIGEPAAVKLPRSVRPHTLPARLDAAACLAVIERIDPDFAAVKGKIEAGKGALTPDYVDEILEYSGFSLDDRFLYKAALSETGLLPRGRRLAR